MHMTRWLLVAAMAIVICDTAAGELTLKKTFFGGWQYSIDGGEYEKVGMSGKGLSSLMWDNQQAHHEMEVYKSRKTWAAVTGWPGGFAVGWVLGAELAGAEWNDAYTVMLAVGIPLCIVSAFCEGSATSHLKSAVSIYNGEAPQGAYPAFYERGRERGSYFRLVKLTLQF